MKIKSFIGFFVLILLGFFILPRVFADQCKFLSNKDYAEKAVEILNQHPNVMFFCLPCNNGNPRPDFFKSAGIKLVELSYKKPPLKGFEIEFESKNHPGSKKAIDLAYTFVQISPDKPIYTNLAVLSGCPCFDTPYTIDKNGPVEMSFPEGTPIFVDLDGYFNISSSNIQNVFKEIDCVAIRDHSSSGYILFLDQKHIDLQSIQLSGKHFSFRTKDGVDPVYRFEGVFNILGRFALMELNGTVLHGHLVKESAGRVLEESDIDFTYFAGN